MEVYLGCKRLPEAAAPTLGCKLEPKPNITLTLVLRDMPMVGITANSFSRCSALFSTRQDSPHAPNHSRANETLSTQEGAFLDLELHFHSA